MGRVGWFHLPDWGTGVRVVIIMEGRSRRRLNSSKAQADTDAGDVDAGDQDADDNGDIVDYVNTMSVEVMWKEETPWARPGSTIFPARLVKRSTCRTLSCDGRVPGGERLNTGADSGNKTRWSSECVSTA